MFALATAALIAVPAVSRAEDSTNTPAAAAPAQRNTSCRSTAKSLPWTPPHELHVGGMTINITSDTKIKKDGKTATLSDIKVGDNGRRFLHQR